MDAERWAAPVNGGRMSNYLSDSVEPIVIVSNGDHYGRLTDLVARTIWLVSLGR